MSACKPGESVEYDFVLIIYSCKITGVHLPATNQVILQKSIVAIQYYF